MRKNILIISRSTYPSIDPRSMRTNELSKEMVRQGHKVTLYVLTSNYDYTSFEEETGVTIKSLGKTYLSKYNHDSGKSLNFFAKVFNKLVGKYIEFPDIELIRNTYLALESEFSTQKEKIDLLITIAVPHPIHWGATLFKTRNPQTLTDTTWVADCGDPYMGNPFKKPPSYFKYIEEWFCNNVDFITVPIKDAVDAYHSKFKHKLRVIPQGFDLDSIDNSVDFSPKNSIPTFIYAGTFYRKYRDPSALLDYLVKLDKNFRFIVYTKNTKFIAKYMTKLGTKLIVKPYITRNELLKKMKNADFLINLENPSAAQSPSKLIDYAMAGRPILSINTSKKLNTKKIDDFLNGCYQDSLKIDNIEQYDIKRVVQQFLALINQK